MKNLKYGIIRNTEFKGKKVRKGGKDGKANKGGKKGKAEKVRKGGERQKASARFLLISVQ